MSNAPKFRKKAVEFEGLKQFERAIANYVRAIEENEHAGEEVDVALFNKVGDLALRGGRVTEAVTYYERAVEHYVTGSLYDNAIALCNKILRNAPGRSNVYFTLGRICARKGLRGDATRNFLEYATRMQHEGKVDEGMRALAEIADLMPELTEVGRLVEEHAARAGISLHRRTTPARNASQAPVEPPKSMFGMSKDLVFLDVDYDIPLGSALKVAPVRAEVSKAVAVEPVIQETPLQYDGEPDAIFDDVFEEAREFGKLADLMIFNPEQEPRTTAPRDIASVVDGTSILKPYVDPATPLPTLPELEPTGIAAMASSPVGTASPALMPGLFCQDTELNWVGMPGGMDTPIFGARVHALPELPATVVDENVSVSAAQKLPALARVFAADANAAASAERNLPTPESAAAIGAAIAIASRDATTKVDEHGIGTPARTTDSFSAANELPPLIFPRASEMPPVAASESADVVQAGDALAYDTAFNATFEVTFDDTYNATFDQDYDSSYDSTYDAAAESRVELPFLVATELLDDPHELDDLFRDASIPTATVAAEATRAARSRREELEDAVGVEPTNWTMRRRLAEALFEGGERDGAIAELNIALSGFERDGQYADAGEVADELVRVAGEEVSHHQKRVEFAIRASDQNRLREAYLDLADTFVRRSEDLRAKAVYARVLEIDPWDDRARTALGDAAPPPPPCPANGADDEHVNLADWLCDDDEPASTRMRMREPESSGNERKDFEMLLRHFKEGVARSLGEDDYDSHYDLGVAYKEMGLLDDAIGEFQKALRSRTYRLAAYEALGQCFLEQHSYKIAVTILSRALHEPAFREEQRVGVLYLLGFSCEALQRFDEARSYFQRVYATDIHFRDVSQRLADLERLIR